MLHVLIIQLYLHTCTEAGSTVRDVSCRMYHRFHALSQASKLCHRRNAAQPLSRTSDKPSHPCLSSWSGNSLRPPRALPCFTPSQRQTMSTSEAPASNDIYLTHIIKRGHMPKSTRLYRIHATTPLNSNLKPCITAPSAEGRDIAVDYENSPTENSSSPPPLFPSSPNLSSASHPMFPLFPSL